MLNGSRALAFVAERRNAGFHLLSNSLLLPILMVLVVPGWGGEDPFLTTYTSQLEEPGNLEVATKSVTAKPNGGSRFLGVAAEFEYSVSTRWMTEVYLDGQATSGQSILFTGYRWENRFRLLAHEHWVNPVFYFEFDDTNAADKTLLDVVGHDGNQSLTDLNRDTAHQKNRELEAKLILGSSFKGWTIAENLIAEKNVRHEPFEFGYALGVSRPVAFSAKSDRCNFCAKNIQVGVEIFGGLGTQNEFGFLGTSQYVAPVAAWTFANGTTLRVSPAFGVTDASAPFVLKFGLSYGFDGFGGTLRNLLHGRPEGTARSS